MNPVIRKMKTSDLRETVKIHTKAFPDFFLSSLGEGFLYELYRDFLLDDCSICLVVEQDSYVKGFCIGNLKPVIFFKRLLYRRGLVFLVHAIKAFVRNPVLVTKKLYYALRYRGEQPTKLDNAALLSSIGVDPAYGKKGFGSLLIKSFCDEAFSRKANVVYLTTDKAENDTVNTFYLRNGFQLESVFIKTNGRKMNRYIKLPDEKAV